MKTETLNLFIVDDDALMVAGLRNHLNHRFNSEITISTFDSGENALKSVDENTDMVILDYFLEGENGNEILKSIKNINPNTEVIMFSSNENMEIAIQSFRNGASDYVIKGTKSWKKITSLVYKTITYPVRMMTEEFGINKHIAMFVVTFLVMGIAVYFSLKFIH